MKERMKLITGGVILTSIVAIAFYRFRAEKKEENIEYINPKIMYIADKKVFYGKIDTKRYNSVKPSISGILDKIYVKLGQRVKKNTPIARIAPIITPNEIHAVKGWSIDDTTYYLRFHVFVPDDTKIRTIDSLKLRIKKILKKYNVTYSTIEFESANGCEDDSIKELT